MVKIQNAGDNSTQLSIDTLNVHNVSVSNEATYDFFKLFQQGGIAYQCVEYLMVKHDLNHQKGFYQGNLTEEDKVYFYDTLPKRIVENRAALNIDFENLFKEVDGNIKQYTSPETKDDYAIGLLRPFANYEKRSARLHAGLQQRAEEIEQGFSNILKENHPQNSVEELYKRVAVCLESYTDWLEYTLAHNGLSLFVLQNKVGIYLTNRNKHIAHRYTQWTSEIEADKIANDLNSKYKL